jgi:hypothetical protein
MPQRIPRGAVAAVLGVATLATTGCGPIGLVAEEAPLFPGVEEAVNPSLGRVEPPTVERLNFRTGPATATFGRREVARGYAAAVWFATATSFTLQTLDSRYHSIGAFTRHSSRMTPEFADEVDQLAWECFDGDEQSCGWLGAMRVYGLEGNGLTLQQDGPLVVDHVIHEAEVWVDDWSDEPTLGVRFEEQASVRMTKAGENWLVPVVKDANYWLVPGPEGDAVTWRVADIDSWYVVEPAVPDTGTY